MRRFIDADELLKEFNPNGEPIDPITVRMRIVQTPTAFNVDKVISNIWDRSELIHIKHNCYDEVEDYIRVTDVSEIVKAGGTDESAN